MLKIKSIAFILSVLIITFSISYLAMAWVPAPGDPPGNNVDLPLNISDIGQRKLGDLRVVGFRTDSHTWLATDGGNVGIGMTDPTHKLDIGGDIRWTGTLIGGSVPWARLTSFPSSCPSGQFVRAVGSSLTCATPPSGGGVGGSGTPFYIPRWDSTGRSLGDSVMTQQYNRIGIGRWAESGWTLDVQGNTLVRGNLRATGNIRADTSITLGGVTKSSWPGYTSTYCYRQTGPTFTVSWRSFAFRTAYCPGGYMATGGGLYANVAENWSPVNWPHSDPRAWNCGINNWTWVNRSGTCYVRCCVWN